MEFNRAQLEALKHGDGPMMVLAGPGSGKTTVLTERLLYLTEEKKVRGENILVITFSSAAALEMEKRYSLRAGNFTEGISFGTFHSVFFRILTRHLSYTKNSIADDRRRREIIKELLSRKDSRLRYGDELTENILSEISFIKNTGKRPFDLPESSFSSLEKEDFLNIYKAYEKTLADEGKLDFDDMLLKCRELFLKRPDILSQYRDLYRYILVDEFQDINQIQYDVLKLLTAPLNNLFVVGDDDQSIYSFRGADPDIMLNFPKDFPDSRKVLLATNYRSSLNIVESSLRLISHNKTRYKKALKAHRGPFAPLSIKAFDSESEENGRLIRDFKKYREQGVDLSKIAVLYRTNSVPERLCFELSKAGIGFSMKEKIKDVFESRAGRDVMAYLCLGEKVALWEKGIKMSFPVDSFLRIMNRPVRYISREAVRNADSSDAGSFFSSLEEFYRERTATRREIRRLFGELSLIGNSDIKTALDIIKYKTGYENRLKEFSEGREAEELLSSLDKLSDFAEDAKDLRGLRLLIEAKRESLRAGHKKAGAKDKNCINFMTFHASKGLEFDIVYIIDAIEGITPYKRAEDRKALEEERRMFYVAMTRAKNILHIFYTKSHYNKACKRSGFIAEIGEEKIKIPWKSLRF